MTVKFPCKQPFFRHGNISEKSPPQWNPCQVQCFALCCVSHPAETCLLPCELGLVSRTFVGFLPWLTALSNRAGRNACTKAPHDQEVLFESLGWFKDFFSTHFATAARTTVSQTVLLSDGMWFFEERSSMPMWPTWTLHISVTTDLSSDSEIISDVSKALDRHISSFLCFSA